MNMPKCPKCPKCTYERTLFLGAERVPPKKGDPPDAKHYMNKWECLYCLYVFYKDIEI